MKKLYLICNAHLDPVWLWQWREGAAEAVSTFRIAADFCEEFDGFVFNHNEALLYEWVEEYEPALFQRIQRLVKEKKWHIMGGWYLQPDCVMPSGESFTRQIETGRKYFLEKFGAAPTTAINFDPFGHTRGLVQIMKKSGYDSYIFMRGKMDYGDFIWKGFDGSEILGHKIYGGYNTLKGQALNKIKGFLEEHETEENAMLLWGIGNHGGGPSRKDLQDIRAFSSARQDISICHATPEAYFKAVDKSGLRVVDHSLVHCMVGCYTSMVRIKQQHRRIENQLARCEKMLLHSGVAYSEAILKDAEKSLLLSEFHDILPGSMIKPAEEDSLRLLSHAGELLDRMETKAFFSLCGGQPKAKENEIPVLVYNPMPWPVETEIEVEYQPANQNWEEDQYTIAKVYDKDGQFLPAQNEKEACTMNLDWRKKLVFHARLAAASMNRFDCVQEVKVNYSRVAPYEEDAAAIYVKSGRLSVKISKTSGLIQEYMVDGVSYLTPDTGFLEVFRDNEDPWGMTVDSFSDSCGSFVLLPDNRANCFNGYPEEKTPNVRVTENGSVRMKVEAIFGWGNSFAVVEYTIPKHDIYLDIQIKMQVNDANHMFKYHLDTAADGAFLGQTAFGTEELIKEGKEITFQKWCALTDETKMLAVVNDGMYAGSANQNTLYLSLLRTPVYAAHPINQRKLAPSDRHLDHIDMGERILRFRILGGQKQTFAAEIDAAAQEYNESPCALPFFPAGTGKKKAPLAYYDNKRIILSSLKKDGTKTTVRLYNSAAQEETLRLSLPYLNREETLTFGAYEVKTMQYDS